MKAPTIAAQKTAAAAPPTQRRGVRRCTGTPYCRAAALPPPHSTVVQDAVDFSPLSRMKRAAAAAAGEDDAAAYAAEINAAAAAAAAETQQEAYNREFERAALFDVLMRETPRPDDEATGLLKYAPERHATQEGRLVTCAAGIWRRALCRVLCLYPASRKAPVQRSWTCTAAVSATGALPPSLQPWKQTGLWFVCASAHATSMPLASTPSSKLSPKMKHWSLWMPVRTRWAARPRNTSRRWSGV